MKVDRDISATSPTRVTNTDELSPVFGSFFFVLGETFGASVVDEPFTFGASVEAFVVVGSSTVVEDVVETVVGSSVVETFVVVGSSVVEATVVVGSTVVVDAVVDGSSVVEVVDGSSVVEVEVIGSSVVVVVGSSVVEVVVSTVVDTVVVGSSVVEVVVVGSLVVVSVVASVVVEVVVVVVVFSTSLYTYVTCLVTPPSIFPTGGSTREILPFAVTASSLEFSAVRTYSNSRPSSITIRSFFRSTSVS